MIDEELSPDKHAHKAAEPSSSKSTAGAAATKGSVPLSIPVPKTDLSAGALTVCKAPYAPDPCTHSSKLFGPRTFVLAK